MKPYGIGIVGYGGFGRFLHQTWDLMKEAGVVGIADMNPANKPEGDVYFTQQWEALLARDDIHILSIATPPNTHEELAIKAMEAGKHILVEKPVALSLDAVDRMIAVRNKTNCVAAVNMMLRFNPLIELFSRWAKDEIFGVLRHASIENHAQDEDLPPSHWFWDSDISGGILIEHSVHFVDLVHQLTTAKPLQIKGGRQTRNDRQEDQVLATVVYDNNLIATHYHEFSGLKMFEETTIRLSFELMTIELHGWIPLEGSIKALGTGNTLEQLRKTPGWFETGRCPVQKDGNETTIRTAGKEHTVSHMVTGQFALTRTKLETYANCLRAMIRDMIRAIENPEYSLRVPLEVGREALFVALEATKDARTR